MEIPAFLKYRNASAYSSLAFLVLICIFVNIGYATYIKNTVFYRGMIQEFSLEKVIISFVLYCVTIGTVFIRKEFFVQKIFVWTFFVLSNISFFTFYQANVLISIVVSFVFCFFCFFSVKSYKQKDYIDSRVIEIFFWLSLAAAVYFFAQNGFKFNKDLFLFEGVYDVRFEVTGGRNFFENMLFSNVTKLFSIICFGYYVYNRNVPRAIISFVAIALLYSTSAQKSILFFAAITFLFCLGKDKDQRALVGAFVVLLIGALCLMPAQAGWPSYSAHSFLTRRLLLIPAWLNEMYLIYYDNDPLFLSHSILNGLVKAYEGPGPTWEMGYRLWGFRTSLNNGVFSDGFINFGYAGSVIYLGIALGLVHFQGRLTSPAIQSALLIYIWQFTNSALIATFVTHGFALFILVGLFTTKRIRNATKVR